MFERSDMLVIKAEIWPGGIVEDRFEIARVAIINRGQSPTASLADYNVIGLLGRDKTEFPTEGVVLGYQRHQGWSGLTSQALRALDRGPSLFHPEYTEAVINLLKKG
jgi:hypothetical protein